MAINVSILAAATKAFRDSGAEAKGIKLLFEAPFQSPEDIYKLLAIGADAVGITPLPPKGSDIMDSARSVSSFLSNLSSELENISLAAACTPFSASKETLRATTYDMASITGLNKYFSNPYQNPSPLDSSKRLAPLRTMIS